MSLMIRFNADSEFLEELGKFHIGPRVVRVTTRSEPSPQFPMLCLFTIIAGFVDDEGRLVELVSYVGDVMRDDDNNPFWSVLANRRAALIDAVRALGHEVRSGRFLLEQRP